MEPPEGKDTKRREKREVIDRRRLMHALISAAILHLLLFTVAELFIDPPGASSSSNRNASSTQVSIQLPSPQSSEEDSNRPRKKTPKPDPEPSPAQNSDESFDQAQDESPEQPSVKPIHTVKEVPEKTDRAKAETTPAPDGEETGQTETSAQSTTLRASKHLTSQTSPPQPGFPSSSSRSEKVKEEKIEFSVYLKELLDTYHRYPLAARRRDIEGQAEIYVSVSKEGTLESLKILRSSGSGILDKAAQDLLEKVFPVDYPLTGTVSTTVRISYRLQDV